MTAWDVWSLRRSDLRGLVVDSGSQKAAGNSARRRNEAARAHGLADAVFIILPRGQQPTAADLPPEPEEAPAPVKSGPRGLTAVENDAATLAVSRFATAADRGRAMERARALVSEAFELGRAEARQEGRKSLGVAWGAFLGTITQEMWQDIQAYDPALFERFRAFVLGEPAQ
jgi:hypothetical protein